MIDARNGVGLWFVIVGIVERSDQRFNSAGAGECLVWCGHSQDGVAILKLGLEPELIGDVFNTITSIVDVNLVENGVVKLVEVRTTRWFLEGNPVGYQGNEIAPAGFSTSKSISIRIVR